MEVEVLCMKSQVAKGPRVMKVCCKSQIKRDLNIIQSFTYLDIMDIVFLKKVDRQECSIVSCCIRKPAVPGDVLSNKQMSKKVSKTLKLRTLDRPTIHSVIPAVVPASRSHTSSSYHQQI